jgi:hypothetical protein
VTKIRAGAIAALAVLLLGTAGCTTESEPPKEPENEVPVISATDAVKEYEGRQKHLKLPDGVLWLEGLGPTRDENGNVLADQPVNVGEAADMADLYWLCEWRWQHLTALDAGDKTTADQAMTTLLTFKQTKLWRLAEEELTKASLGDPSLMRLYYDAQCDYLVFAK